ncbi:hypothetical protein J6590_041945 [Homalodisca vitripennis]|nr:hypothetical protein J6590_041945 [Homalodisca vitripennis]
MAYPKGQVQVDMTCGRSHIPVQVSFTLQTDLGVSHPFMYFVQRSPDPTGYSFENSVVEIAIALTTIYPTRLGPTIRKKKNTLHTESTSGAIGFVSIRVETFTILSDQYHGISASLFCVASQQLIICHIPIIKPSPIYSYLQCNGAYRKRVSGVTFAAVSDTLQPRRNWTTTAVWSSSLPIGLPQQSAAAAYLWDYHSSLQQQPTYRTTTAVCSSSLPIGLPQQSAAAAYL